MERRIDIQGHKPEQSPVTEMPTATPNMEAPEGYESKFNIANTKIGKMLTAMTATAVSMGGVAPAMAGETAGASNAPIVGEPIVTHTTTVHAAKSKASAESFSKVKVIANHRTVSKAKIKEAKKEGRCETYTGKEAIKMGIKTQGYNGTGTSYAYENRRTTACDTNGDGQADTRAECGNKLIVRKPKPEQAKNIAWIKDWSKAKIVVKDVAKAEARAECRTANTSAMAYGRGVGRGRAALRFKNGVKVTGKGVSKLIVEARGEAGGKASAAALADASVECKEMGGTIVVPITPETPETPETPTKGKEGTQTPTPAEAGAPGGTNPPPHEDEPHPGGHACYDEESGDPVPPEDGLCPPGSYGEVN